MIRARSTRLVGSVRDREIASKRCRCSASVGNAITRRGATIGSPHPILKEMGRTASQNKPCKHPKHPAKVDIRTLPNEIGEGYRDRVIRNPGDRVRGHVEPDKPRLPKQTKAVRGKLAVTENLRKEWH